MEAEEHLDIVVDPQELWKMVVIEPPQGLAGVDRCLMVQSVSASHRYVAVCFQQAGSNLHFEHW